MSDKYKGHFDVGYEKIRETILANQKKMGIVPASTELSPMNPLADVKSVDGKPFPAVDLVRPWDSLSADEKRLFARMAEVYAGYCTYTDHETGRLIDYLEQTGELDNTLIVWISDNGASGEGGPNGSVNENKFFNAVPDDMEENLALHRQARHAWRPTTTTPPAGRWPSTRPSSSSSATPGRAASATRWSCTGRQASRPKASCATSTHTASTSCPPSTSASASSCPSRLRATRSGRSRARASSTASMTPTPRPRKDSQFYVMLGTRALWRDGWKADAIHAGAPSDWSHFAQDEWALYNTAKDRSECHDVADDHPELLKELIALWHVQAGQYFGLPLEDRDAISVLTTPRPQMSPPRDRYVYFPSTLEVPEAVAVNVRGRSFKIAAEVDLEKGAEGVLFAHGHHFGGHALYIKDGKLKYVYDFLGEKEQTITSDVDVPTGPCVLGVEFVKEKFNAIRNSPVPNQCEGTATLFIDDKKAGELKGMVHPARQVRAVRRGPERRPRRRSAGNRRLPGHAGRGHSRAARSSRWSST